MSPDSLVFLGHVPFMSITGRLALPEGYEESEATENLVACLAAEAERQAVDKKIAAAPILRV